MVTSLALAAFSNEDENEDQDLYDRLGPGTRTSSTASAFQRETKSFSRPVTAHLSAHGGNSRTERDVGED